METDCARRVNTGMLPAPPRGNAAGADRAPIEPDSGSDWKSSVLFQIFSCLISPIGDVPVPICPRWQVRTRELVP